MLLVEGELVNFTMEDIVAFIEEGIIDIIVGRDELIKEHIIEVDSTLIIVIHNQVVMVNIELAWVNLVDITLFNLVDIALAFIAGIAIALAFIAGTAIDTNLKYYKSVLVRWLLLLWIICILFNVGSLYIWLYFRHVIDIFIIK